MVSTQREREAVGHVSQNGDSLQASAEIIAVDVVRTSGREVAGLEVITTKGVFRGPVEENGSTIRWKLYYDRGGSCAHFKQSPEKTEVWVEVEPAGTGQYPLLAGLLVGKEGIPVRGLADEPQRHFDLGPVDLWSSLLGV